MILERIYNLAKPALADRKIKDIRMGLELMATELDNGAIGVTYALRKEMGHTCRTLSQAGNFIGMKAEEIGEWAVSGNDVITRAMGLAVLNSVAETETLKQYHPPQGSDAVFAVEIQPTDTIGVVGHIGPVINRLRDKKDQLLIFERDESKGESVYPESAQSELLPKCQVVFITSATLINGTLENLLNNCTGARDIVMVGSSTPFYPQAFYGTGVTVLAGTKWLHSNRDLILTGVSQCAGMKQLIKYGQKISVKVNE